MFKKPILLKGVGTLSMSFVVILAIACASTSDASDSIRTPAQPTATLRIVEVTAAPVATTPPPTVGPTSEPEPTPFSVLTDELFAEITGEILAKPIVEFPASLMKGSDPLSDDEVLAEWSN